MSYTGTQIAADGRRYTIGDINAPTVPSAVPGKMITQSALDAALGVIENDLGDLDALLVRTITDGVLNSTTLLTSATAVWTAADVGAVVAGTGIPVGTTIASRTNATNVVLSAAATATATGVTVSISRKLAKVVDVLEV